ncbi:MAG TPA: adenosylcobinamide-GDP ribazoletransferase [Candidatus Nanopelagicaceae bacterium]|nr:adenosylcobinamide-GDP ribazoletransferase [Candidatus Nanopelagicaceae bacterium]
MVDAFRLSFGTFTGIKIAPPRRVDAQTFTIALFLSFLPAFVVSGLAWLAGYLIFLLVKSSMVAAVTVIGMEILLTSGLHIDGLMDTADGAASLSKGGRQRALEIMKIGNSGPAAFATALIVILLQVATLSTAFIRGQSSIWIVGALLARYSVVLACRVGGKGAREDGMGIPFIGVVDRFWLALATVVNSVMVVSIVVLDRSWTPLVALIAVIAVGEVLRRKAEEQFGGLTGDVLGSILEKVRTIALLILVLKF